MKEKLQTLLANSYSPYSHFRVAAIAIMKDGREFSGVNVENASYGATICAERSAIVSAITAGYQKGDFIALYIMVDSPRISTCCFACRQVITEFFAPQSEIICMNQTGDEKTYQVRDLCPLPFDEGDLQ
jgi:cytidine deaminase